MDAPASGAISTGSRVAPASAPQRPRQDAWSVAINTGGPERCRTACLRIADAALSRLSYRPGDSEDVSCRRALRHGRMPHSFQAPPRSRLGSPIRGLRQAARSAASGNLAGGAGFEPACRFRQPVFEAGPLGLSGNHPFKTNSATRLPIRGAGSTLRHMHVSLGASERDEHAAAVSGAAAVAAGKPDPRHEARNW